MELRYVTREMGDPRGRPKVFFSCHPADFDMAFSLVSEDVLKRANCAVWYDPELPRGGQDISSEKERKEYLAALDGMQLMVFAVTSRFLEEPSRARDLELPYALKAHIPVLPLMLEKNLEHQFNAVCAPIQLVNRYVDDPTATPYDEVLKTFLGSVLVGNELAQRVRNAFDAYVFLSYRKKDRRHARRLIDLIHQNDEFRDIAIWFDEYLVPGEAFDDAIRAALAKSSLFALAVTPQLLEEGNYVMDEEFPRARERQERQHDLQIVPVELYDPEYEDPRTNRAVLAEKYERIPPVQDEQKPAQVGTALVDALAAVGRRTCEGTPQHHFFMALAYLCGIDQEPDYEQALKLMTMAAKPKDATKYEPCLEATERLVDMYLLGEGVARDVKEALRWQRTVVDQCGAAFARHHDPDEHRGLGTRRFKALLRLSDLLRENDDKQGAIEAAEEALAFADELEAEVGVREMDRDRAVALNRLGELHQKERRPQRAWQCLQQAKAIYDRQAREMNTRRARRDLSVSLERLGDLARACKDLNRAEDCYRQALGIRQSLVATKSSAHARRDLSGMLTKLGNVRADKRDARQALNLYEQALELDRLLEQELRTPQAVDDYCVSLTKVADMQRVLGDGAGAVTRYDAARLGYESLIEKTGALRYRKNHARCQGKLASAHKHAGRAVDAARCYCACIDEWEEISQREGQSSDETAHELAVAYFNQALFAGDRAALDKSVELWEDLVSRNDGYRRFLDQARKLHASPTRPSVTASGSAPSR